tara:strand:+ start:35 stop:1147 length:1113 start_codon:yes stop_codon:yes gene_type:complete
MSLARDLADLGSSATRTAGSNNKNMIINGAMNVAQRATSATGLGGSFGYFVCDRWRSGGGSTAGRFTMTQESDGPSGFANCTKLACTTADTSIAAGESLSFQQVIEGQDLQRIGKGTSDAKEITFSFYAKANAAATYTAELFDANNSRQISKTFSVTTAWTRVSLTYPADTTGAFTDSNAAALYIIIWLHAGSDVTSGTLNSTSWAANVEANRVSSSQTSFLDSTARTFFITGVQLEVGDTATDFEHRSFGDELQACQRYYQKSFEYGTAVGSSTQLGSWSTGGHQGGTTTGYIEGAIIFEQHMRATPTLTIYDHSGNSGKSARLAAGVARYQNENVALSQTSSRGSFLNSASGTAAGIVQAHYTADAEL